MINGSTEPTIAFQTPVGGPAFQNRAGADNRSGSTSQYLIFGVILLLSVTAAGFAVAYFVGKKSEDPPPANNRANDESNKDTGRSIPASQATNQPAPVSQSSIVPTPVANRSPVNRPVPEPPAGSRTAVIPRGPTNIRATPDGTVQCVQKTGATVRIYGDTGVYDNNGLWYYTDACGGSGVIHSSQFRLIK